MIEFIEHNIILVLFLQLWVCLFSLISGSRKATLAFSLAVNAIGLAFSTVLLSSILFPVRKTIENSFVWFQCGDLTLHMGIYIDNISAVFLFVLMAVSLCVSLFSYGYMKDDESFGRYFCFLNFFCFAMSALLISSNLIQTYIFWELVGVASYLLIGFWYKRTSVSNAAKRVFWTNRFGDFALLLGIIILVYYSVLYPQTFNQAEILSYSNLDNFVLRIQSLMTSQTYVFICLLLLFGAFVKSAQFPFQTWLVDAMKAPTPISALIHSATMVCAGLFLVLRLYPMFIISGFLIKVILAVGLFTAIICGLFAIAQRNLKKMLAYSTSSQLGLMFAALGFLSPTAAMFYMCAHAFTKASLFLVTGRVSKLYGGELNMNKLGGIRQNHFLLAIFWLIASLSLSGIIFTGYSAKETLYSPFYHSHDTLLFILILSVAVITPVYLFKAYFKMFEGEDRKEKNSKTSITMATGLLLITIFGLLIGHIFNNEFLKLITPKNFFFTEFFDFNLTLILLLSAITGAVFGFWAFKHRTKIQIIPRIFAKYFYRGGFIDIIFKIAGLCYWGLAVVLKFIDDYIIDGVIKLSCLISHKSSYLIRKIQNGNFQTYLAYSIFSIGVILFLAFQIYVHIVKELW